MALHKTEFFVQNVNVVDKSLFTAEFDITCRIHYRKQNTLNSCIRLKSNARESVVATLLVCREKQLSRMATTDFLCVGF